MIDVILPVLDEAEALPWVLGLMPSDCRPIVVDNGSTDGSGDVARSLGASVVTEHTPGSAPPATRGCWQRPPRPSASWIAMPRADRRRVR